MVNHTCHALTYKWVLGRYYKLSPAAQLDGVLDQKRAKALAPILDALHTSQMALAEAYSEFKYCYTHGSGQTTFHYLAGLYGTLNKRTKEFVTLVKKHSSQPEIAKYYDSVNDVVCLDVYNTMKEDFEIALPYFQARRDQDIVKYPHWDKWEPVEPDWENVNARFKAAK